MATIAIVVVSRKKEEEEEARGDALSQSW